MRKNTLTLLLALLALGATAAAATVPEAVARRVAINFWNTHHPASRTAVSDLKPLAFDGLSHLYIYAHGDEGFVVVAGDDRVMPVLGYSFDDPFPQQELNPELRYWLGGYERQLVALERLQAEADPRWERLLSDEVPPVPVSLQDVPMLVPVRWDQDEPYNNYCPYDEEYRARTVVGCVATAMAQIMRRWNHPYAGTGTHSYQHHSLSSYEDSYGILSANFGQTTYRWEEMPEMVSHASTDGQRDAVATLSYHCGVAVDMMYGPSVLGGSGAYSSCGYWATACAENAFKQYFKYSDNLQFHMRDGYTESEWTEMIDNDLALGRPMYYSGSDPAGGHAFVLDGSDLEQRYHFNWGWSGRGNGYYTINNLAPGSGGSGGNATYTFNSDQGAIFGIEPVAEVFDTIERYDTTCRNFDNLVLYNYTLPNAACDTLLHHLDTVVLLHLALVNPSSIVYEPNGAEGGRMQERYCHPRGIVLSECPYTYPGYRFRGWCTNRRGRGTIYPAGELAWLRGDQQLFAIWVDSSAAILEADDQGRLGLWPNPVSGRELAVSLPSSCRAQLLVADAVGRIVLRQELALDPNGQARILLPDLPAGIYTVQVETEESIYNKRIIKQ